VKDSSKYKLENEFQNKIFRNKTFQNTYTNMAYSSVQEMAFGVAIDMAKKEFKSLLSDLENTSTGKIVIETLKTHSPEFFNEENYSSRTLLSLKTISSRDLHSKKLLGVSCDEEVIPKVVEILNDIHLKIYGSKSSVSDKTGKDAKKRRK